MNWDAIGAVGEILGATAVVATLAYLARQLRQESRSDTAETMGSWLADYNGIVLDLLRDPEVARIFRQGLTDFEQLSRNDQMRFHAWMVPHLLNAQILWFQWNDGIMHRQVAEQQLTFNAMMLRTKGGAFWWSTARGIWRPEFVEHIDKLIEEVSPITEIWPWFATTDQESSEAVPASTPRPAP